MTEKITGYRSLTDLEVEFVNEIKALGCHLEDMVVKLHSIPEFADPRWVSIGQTHLQQGLMALVRAVTKPEGF